MLLLTVCLICLTLGALFWFLRSRMTLVMQVICVASLSAASGIAVVGSLAFEQARSALVVKAGRGLEGVVGGRGNQAEGYFRNIREQIMTCLLYTSPSPRDS